jgi:hypothetical protein
MTGFTTVADIISARDSGQWLSIDFKKTAAGVANPFGDSGGWNELFTGSGNPSAGSFAGSAGVGTQLNNATAGALAPVLAVTPAKRHLLSMQAATNSAGAPYPNGLILCDFLFYYPALVVTGTPTTLDNSATLSRYTDGIGVMGITAVQSALGASSAQLTFTYTGAVNAGSQTSLQYMRARAVSSLGQTANVDTDIAASFMTMTAGDTGIKSVQSYTLTGGTTGTVAVVLVKPLAYFPVYLNKQAGERDYVFNIPSLPKIEDGACLGFLSFGTGANVSATFEGYVTYGWK